MPRKKPVPGANNIVPGRGGYPLNFIRQVRDAWASGEYANDTEIAEAFNLSRTETICEWRKKAAPDGITWESIRDKLNQGALDVIAQRLGESSADATLRHLKIVRAAQTTVARYIFGQRLELADGTTMSIPSVEPKSLGEAVKSYIDLVRIERHMRGEPDVRVEHYLMLVGEVVAEVATLFVAEMGLPAARVVRFEELFGDKLKGALADAERKLLPAGTEAERWTADEGEEE